MEVIFKHADILFKSSLDSKTYEIALRFKYIFYDTLPISAKAEAFKCAHALTWNQYCSHYLSYLFSLLYHHSLYRQSLAILKFMTVLLSVESDFILLWKLSWVIILFIICIPGCVKVLWKILKLVELFEKN